ncbi:MAG: hypothetical protein KGP14_11320 [Betaproteobacteria bacterium]|nr:hypothetical protein [Betaproteobacteria bacterium]
MTISKPALKWVTILSWHRAELVGFTHLRGLFRARLDGETMFIGRAATQGSGLKARLDAYRKPNGTGRNHYAGRMIYEHRAEIDMQIAELDLPPFEINLLADKMIACLQPRWNMSTDRFRS